MTDKRRTEAESADELREREERARQEHVTGRPEHDPSDPFGDTAYPGEHMLPPTGDLKHPPPSTGMPGEPEDDDEEA